MTEREAILVQEISKHRPMIAFMHDSGKPVKAWIYCSCGFNEQYKTDDPEEWSRHIQSLSINPELILQRIRISNQLAGHIEACPVCHSTFPVTMSTCETFSNMEKQISHLESLENKLGA